MKMFTVLLALGIISAGPAFAKELTCEEGAIISGSIMEARQTGVPQMTVVNKIQHGSEFADFTESQKLGFIKVAANLYSMRRERDYNSQMAAARNFRDRTYQRCVQNKSLNNASFGRSNPFM